MRSVEFLFYFMEPAALLLTWPVLVPLGEHICMQIAGYPSTISWYGSRIGWGCLVGHPEETTVLCMRKC